MKTKLSISVVIPAFNEAEDIAKCLDSIKNQTVAPDEIIIVDNNSTDDTLKIASKYDGIKIIKENRQGITYTRTTGFNNAKSDIIARIDADTIASPKWVEAIVNKFSNDKTACGLAGRVAFRELSPEKYFWFGSISAMLRRISDLRLGKGMLMYGCNLAVRRKAWEKVSDYVHLDDCQISEDVDFSLFIKKTGKIKYCNSMIVKTKMFDLIFNLPKLSRYRRTDIITLAKHVKLDAKGIDFKHDPTKD
ncbi:MAG: glycosyltransferase family 2 protein [Candidatus Saccharibacteria bacterium]